MVRFTQLLRWEPLAGDCDKFLKERKSASQRHGTLRIVNWQTQQFSEQATAPQLSESNEGESWCIGVFLKTESSHEKQVCTTVIASTDVQYWHRKDSRQERTTAHNTTWSFSSFKIVQKWKQRTHPSFCINLRQRWISDTTLDVMKFRMRRILSMDGDRVIASSLCDRVRKTYVQIQVGTSTTVQCTSTNTWSRNLRGNCTGYK